MTNAVPAQCYLSLKFRCGREPDHPHRRVGGRRCAVSGHLFRIGQAPISKVSLRAQ
jgi:hypothetical protein